MAYTLKRFEERFAYFVRVRRNVLVNPLHIRAWEQLNREQLTLYLSDGTTVMASRPCLSQVINYLTEKPIS